MFYRLKGIKIMAGFFGFFDYTKPGPGVPKPDETAPKNGIKIFFEILQRKFWKIIRIGMLFFILNIPALLVASFVANYFSLQLLGNMEELEESASVVLFWASVLLTAFPIVNFGPVRAGFDSVFRNYSREEHSFIWSDFKDNMKSNFKQSMIVSILNLVIFIILVFDIILIRSMVFDSVIVWTLFNTFFVLMFILYLMINIYLYPMMVTFELSTKNLIKNSLMFAFARFIPNLIILVIIFGFLTLPFLYLNPVFAVFVSFLLLYGILGFLQNFFAYRGFKKYIIDKLTEKKRNKDEELSDQN
jgi:uncharacterized membrane protein YesL